MDYLWVMKLKKFKNLAGIFFSFALVVALLAPLHLKAAERSPIIVELFTSQGCSSCPAADDLLDKLTQMDGIVGLSFHVDYWDYIGWKDPFALPDNTLRQRSYSQAFHKTFVYTPQMVIHGTTEATGSDGPGVRVGLQRAQLGPDVNVRLEKSKEGLKVRIAGSPQPAQAAVWLALFDPLHETKIRRGENRGRTVRNVNVVREFRKIGQWRGQRMTLNISAADLKQHKGKGCAVFLQNEHKGPILGAATIAQLN